MPTDVFNSSGTWTAPAGITGSVLVEAWGGGGGGTDYAGGNAGAGGGGGGYASDTITPTTGDVYTITVGAGGTANSTAGGTSSVTSPAPATIVNASGGNRAVTTFGGAGGGATIGAVRHTGGSGGDGSVGAPAGGGGGGSAFTGSDGNSGASGSSGGAGGTGTGNGGTGGHGLAPATAGTAPGGAGAGGNSTQTVSSAGAAGRVQFTYTLGTAADLSWQHALAREDVSRRLLPNMPFSPWLSRQQTPPNIPGTDIAWRCVRSPELVLQLLERPAVRWLPTATNLPSVDVSWLHSHQPESVHGHEPPVRQFAPWLSVQAIWVTYTAAQLGNYGIANVFTSAQQGSYRIANAIAGYNLYVGLGTIPDLTQAPAAFSATLPFSYVLPLPGSGTRTYYFLVQAQDEYGLVSQNQFYKTLTLDSSGNQITPPMTDPTNLQLYPRQGQSIRVLAQYAGYGVDTNPATTWNVWVSSNPVDTSNPPTAVIDVLDSLLAVDLATYAPGTWYVGAALFRASDSSLSGVLLGTIIMPPLPAKPTPVAGGAQL